VDITAEPTGQVRPNSRTPSSYFAAGGGIDSSIPEAELSSRLEEGGFIMAVADGVGGHAAGEVASRGALTEAFRLILRAPKWMLSLDDPATREEEIQAFYDRAKGYIAGMHAALMREAKADPTKTGMGTTLTVAYSVGWDLFIVHVGDSRAYLSRRGEIRRITRDHTLAQNLADAGEIPQEEVASHPQRHVLTRVIGGSDGWLRGDTHHLRLEPGDCLVVCSDGLTAVVGVAEIAEVLGRENESARACQVLLDLALASRTDNVTAIVALFGS
jgi:protein phosphatase